MVKYKVKKIGFQCYKFKSIFGLLGFIFRLKLKHWDIKYRNIRKIVILPEEVIFHLAYCEDEK